MPEKLDYDGSYSLSVKKREKFARLVSLGASAVDAYVQAGFSPATAAVNSRALKEIPEVAARIAHLRAIEEKAQQIELAEDAAEDAIVAYWSKKSNLLKEQVDLLTRARVAGALTAEQKALDALAKLGGFYIEARSAPTRATLNHTTTNQTVNLIDQQSMMKLIESLNDAEFNEE